MITDAHLDLAYNVMRGRDVRMAAKDQPVAHSDVAEIATVGFPDLRAGGVGLICATIFCPPGGSGDRRGYTTAEEAHAIALEQLAWYRQMCQEGYLTLVRCAEELPRSGDTGFQTVHGELMSGGGVIAERHSHGLETRATAEAAAASASAPIRAILLMEGADALRSPADVAEWFDAGLRIVGLAWRKTRSAGGTGAPGPLTDEGRALVREFDRLGIIHDASHLAEESFWQLLNLAAGPVMASHSNCRAIVGSGDRHLTDEMIRAIFARGGVIGINFYDQFLQPESQYRRVRCSLSDVIAHVKRMCDLAGDARHVGLGTDMDGGLGREQIPHEITTIADLPRVADALSAAGFGDADVAAIMSDNWLRFFREHLPH